MNTTLTLKINEGGNTTGNIIHTQTVPISNSFSGDLTVVIDKEVPLLQGRPYTFSLTWADPGTITFSNNSGDMYPDGVILINNVPSMGGADLYFAVYQGQEIFIPTMSEWGLLIFGLLVLNIGVFFVQVIEREDMPVFGN